MQYGSEDFNIHRLGRIAKGFLAIGDLVNARFVKRQALRLIACYEFARCPESSQKKAIELSY